MVDVADAELPEIKMFERKHTHTFLKGKREMYILPFPYRIKYYIANNLVSSYVRLDFHQ